MKNWTLSGANTFCLRGCSQFRIFNPCFPPSLTLREIIPGIANLEIVTLFAFSLGDSIQAENLLLGISDGLNRKRVFSYYNFDINGCGISISDSTEIFHLPPTKNQNS